MARKVNSQPQTSEGLEKRINVSFDATPITTAIDEVARLSGFRISYVTRVFKANTVVTLRAQKMKVRDVLTSLLYRTGVRFESAVDGSVKLVDDTDSLRLRKSTHGGTVTGKVIDSITKNPISSARLILTPGSRVVATNMNGSYEFEGVDEGEYVVTVKAFGYKSVSRAAVVEVGRVSIVQFTITQVLTQLNSIVTTATGQQRKMEVGNSVATINVDSVIRNAPVNTLTDILDGRVPGLTVSRSSGAPGAPARIRVRGIGSIAATNDPIIILNGTRIYSDQTSNKANPNYSVLDQIDIHSIEAIEVLRGPSASALYGSDAAAGVIVITTKRGSAGKTRWGLGTNQQLTTQPKSFPTRYYRRGIVQGVGATTQQCQLGDQSCVADSLFVFNILNDPRLTVLGTGRQQNYNASVSGGTSTTQYFLTGQTSKDLGLLKMSKADVALLEEQTNLKVSGWQKRPQAASQLSGTSRISLQVTPNLNVDITAAINQSSRSTTPMDGALATLYSSGTTPDDTSLVSRAIPDFRRRSTYTQRSMNAIAAAQWAPLLWLNVASDIGLQTTSRHTKELLRNGDCPQCSTDDGSIREERGDIVLGSVNMRASAQIPGRRSVKFTPTFGFNYTRTSEASVTVSANSLPRGSSSFFGAGAYPTPTTTGQEPISFGIFINLGISLFDDRVFTSTGTRIDASNALGKNVRPVYPKVDVSYLLSRESFYPSQWGTARLRFAFGHAAVQPELGATQRTYIHNSAIINGITFPAQLLSTLGNTNLRPERSTEIEGGFDLGLLDERLTVGFSAYRKLSRDALVTSTLPLSVGGGSLTSNIGSVRNSGIEAVLDAIVKSSDLLRWSVNASVSNNKNRLVKLAPEADVTSFSESVLLSQWFGRRYVEGYPLDGVWMRPVIAYGDENGDGAIGSTELIRSDSSVYIGSPIPNYELNFGTQLGLWNSRISFAAGMAYQNGMAQVNAVKLLDPLQRELNDPTTSLEEQASARSGYASLHSVSLLRLSALSVRLQAPEQISRKLKAGGMAIALQGSNLGLWTSYSGSDPNVSSTIKGNRSLDNGQIPLPRLWSLNISLNF